MLGLRMAKENQSVVLKFHDITTMALQSRLVSGSGDYLDGRPSGKIIPLILPIFP